MVEGCLPHLTLCKITGILYVVQYVACASHTIPAIYLHSFYYIEKKCTVHCSWCYQHCLIEFIYLLFQIFSKEYINILLTVYFLFLGVLSLAHIAG